MVGRVAAVPGVRSGHIVESFFVSVTVEVRVSTRLREHLHDKKRRGVTDDALLNEPFRSYEPRTRGRKVHAILG